MPVLGVCLTLLGAVHGAAKPPGPPVFMPGSAFTLAWMHSIEKVRWEEDYEVRAPAKGGQMPTLHLVHARIRGSAAGMEPAPDSVLRNGWFEYTPQPSLVPELRLTRSEFTADYDWCNAGRCQPLSNFMAASTDLTRAEACFGE